jgi:hypothetical protein
MRSGAAMPALRTTRRLLTAYADKESWKRDHDEAQSCRDVEEKLAWGVHIFKGLLDLEARTQSRALKDPSPEAEQLLELMPLLYQFWAEVSEFYLERAREFLGKGFAVDGLDEFQEAVEEARCLVGNLALEDEIRPIEELLGRSRPDNPRPERYGE